MNENMHTLTEYGQYAWFDYQDVAMQADWRAALQRWPLLQEINEQREQGALE